MKYFTSDYLQFFKELAGNNNKEWFDKNRKRYETSVREPFKVFVDTLINEISKDDSEVQITHKEAIFRINRDIRFAKDKTPYKLNNSAIISKTGRKDKVYPGIYIELGPEKLGIYGGVFSPDTNQIEKIRNYISKNQTQFEKLISSKGFKNTYGEIKGTKAKRIPKEYKEIGEEQPLIYNKQWYYFIHLSPEIIESDDLMGTIVSNAKIAKGLREFFKNALN
ncbi:DUF2461 domain-containing protein [Urechidicola croceus]|uniref:TIGR02453 family protein n=1 Tax=Urechidicola croceus TaxID=1850246 RepID=A0A1D8P6H2_9FLAO|nr:DUF2461 domain-containing protein [Urechidicola croceus]AOW20181.1 hypothetical protein LPB138_05575 [Urechidicola croceus]